MGGRSIPRAAALGYMGEGRAWGKPRVRGSGRGGRGEASGGAERSDSCAERDVGEKYPSGGGVGIYGRGKSMGKAAARAKRAQCKNSFSALDNQRKVLYNKSNTTYERNLRMNTMNNTPTAKSGVSGVVIPVFAAVALIISCAIYIVYKLGQQEAAEKWADYDECGWS